MYELHANKPHHTCITHVSHPAGSGDPLPPQTGWYYYTAHHSQVVLLLSSQSSNTVSFTVWMHMNL